MKKVILFILVAICLVIINNLVHSIIDLWQKQEFLTTAQANLQQEEQQNKKLQNQLKVVSQKQFVEEQARDKLLLIKPGENVVLIPTGMLPQGTQSNTNGEVIEKPHWQEWWEYFFQ